MNRDIYWDVYNIFKSDLFTIFTIWAFRLLNTQFQKLKSDGQKVPKLAETKEDGEKKQQKCNFNLYTQTKVKQHHIFSETLFWKLQNGICR